jgi:DNA-binding CsgD family transcriptional regulator
MSVSVKSLLLSAGTQPRDISTAIGVSYKTIANTCTMIKVKLGFQSIKELSQKAYEFRDIL